MNKNKFKKLTLTLASAIVASSLGGAVLSLNAAADTVAADTYALSDVFSATNATVKEETVGSGATADKVTAFTLEDEGSATIKRSLALKWYKEKNQVQYFSTTFAFKELNFESVTVSMDTPSAWATKDSMATNTVTFTKDGENIKVAVNDDEAQTVQIAAGEQLTLSLFEDTDVDGEFSVYLKASDNNVVQIGSFVNVGANYAEYTSGKKYPLTFKAETADDEKAVVLLYDINGQQFNKLNADNKIVDNAAPVLVVNEKIDGFLLGTAFALDYTVVDVLESKADKKDLKYYQYNPNHLVTENDENYKKYQKLSTSVWFYETAYYYTTDKLTPVAADTENAKTTTVFAQHDKEFVSIKLEAGDGANEYTYDLSWYTNATETKDGVDYIIVDKNEEGPAYKTDYVYNDRAETKRKDDFDTDAKVIAFREQLADAAKDLYAGDSAYIYLPSFEWLIGDNNGYRNLKFTISYKTPTADSASTSSNLSYNALKIAVGKIGTYEFKIFANDSRGNAMEYYLDGKLVKVTSTNVWQIEAIPAFTFDIGNHGIMIDADEDSVSNRKDTQILDKKYSFSDIDVVGARTLRESYKMYTVDRSKYNAGLDVDKQLTSAQLSSVTYAAIASLVDVKSVTDGDYFDAYLTAYAKCLVEKTGAAVNDTSVAKMKSCFVAVKEYDSRITEENAPTEWNEYNKYQWTPSTQSFMAVEEGTFLIIADYWDDELAYTHRAGAYRVITVESKADVIEGEDDWLANNVVSVILFSIAGVMLILIVVLSVIKPSDETLEEVDAKAAKEKTKKEKKDK